MNNKIYKKEELAYLFQTDSMCVYDKKIYFSAKNYDALVSVNLNDFSCHIECQFLDKNLSSYCAHSKIILYNNYIYCIPRYSSDVIKYDLSSKEIYRISIHDLKDNRSLFTEAILIGKKILCFPEFFPWVITIDVETDEITYIKEITEVEKEQYKFISNAVIKKKEVLIPFYSKRQLLIVDTDNYGITTKELQINAKGCSHIACTKMLLCVMGVDSVCYIMNNVGEVLAKIQDVDDEMFTLDDVIWLIDKKAKKIYTIKYNNSLQCVEYKIRNQNFCVIKNSEWIKVAVIHGYISILIMKENGEMGIFMCNVQEECYNVLFIDNLYKEFLQGKNFFREHEDTPLPIIDIVTQSKGEKQNNIQNIGEKIYCMM